MNQITLTSTPNDELDSWFDKSDDKNIYNNLNNSPNNNLNKSLNNNLNNNLNTPDNIFSKSICIEEIIKNDASLLSSNQVIQYECSIAYFIQVLIENSTNLSKNKFEKIMDINLTIDKLKNIKEYLSWISLSSEILAKRIGQTLLVYKYDNKPSINRSSYNFCTKYTQCKNFYNKHETPSCKEHHYVHSLLKYDIDSVIEFLDYIINNNLDLSKNDLHNIYLSIKTICFVTRHMAKEISYIDYITKNNSEVFHRSNPFDYNKKHYKNWTNEDKSFFKNNFSLSGNMKDRNHNNKNNSDKSNKLNINPTGTNKSPENNRYSILFE